MDKTVISYAQNREDLILSGFFSPHEQGFYIDVGAHDPIEDSVTKYFYDRGWKGINIEPLKQYYLRLCEYRPRDTNLNIALSSIDGEVVLREYILAQGLSTVSDSQKGAYESRGQSITRQYKDHKVRTKTLEEVFKDNNVKKISFMKIDVEGHEYEVLKGNDWKLFRPEIICIEANHIEKDWQKLLRNYQYEKVFFDGLNEYYVANEKQERKAMFSYVDAVIHKAPVDLRDLQTINELERTKGKLEQLRTEVVLKTKEVDNLEAKIRTLTPLRRHIKRQIKSRFQRFDERAQNKLSGRKAYKPETANSYDSYLINSSDRKNFREYNRSNQRTLRLNLYFIIRKLSINLVSVMLKLSKV